MGDLKSLIQGEIKRGAGAPLDPGRKSFGVLHALYEDTDYREAQNQVLALEVNDSDDSTDLADETRHLKLRVLQYRGDTRSVEKQVRQEHEKKQEAASDENIEIQCILARNLCLEGRWEELETHCLRFWELKAPNAPMSTVLSMHQLHSLALAELGRWSEAMGAVQRAETLAPLMPETPAALYVGIMRVKCLARINGISAAKKVLDEVWRAAVLSSKINGNTLLTLCRAEVDLERLETAGPCGRMLSWGFAALSFADLIGDDLYFVLGLLDLPSPDRSKIDPRISNMTERFPRTRCLVGEIRAVISAGTMASSDEFSGISTTAQAIARCREYDPEAKRIYLEKIESYLITADSDSKRVEYAWLAGFNLLIDLANRKIHRLERRPRATRALATISETAAASRGRISKVEFFRRVWGPQKYSELLHGQLVANLLHRLKGTFGVVVIIEEGFLQLRSRIVHCPNRGLQNYE